MLKHTHTHTPAQLVAPPESHTPWTTDVSTPVGKGNSSFINHYQNSSFHIATLSERHLPADGYMEISPIFPNSVFFVVFLITAFQSGGVGGTFFLAVFVLPTSYLNRLI